MHQATCFSVTYCTCECSVHCVLSVYVYKMQSHICVRYVGSLSHGKAESMVKNLYDGVFLVRENSQNRGEYNICIRCVSTRMCCCCDVNVT